MKEELLWTRGVPWQRIEAVFLDVGNTMVGIDLALVAARLLALGTRVTQEELERAEAAARPALSSRLAAGEAARRNAFLIFLEGIFARIKPAPRAPAELAERLAPELCAFGAADMLWNRPLSGAREALDLLRELGLPVVAVSNSDGTAERSLERAGLRDGFLAVVDSHLVGVAKPDPAIFAPAFEHVRVARDRAVYVGDMYHVDVAAARAAGMHAVLLDPFGDWPDTDCEKARDLREAASRLARSRA